MSAHIEADAAMVSDGPEVLLTDTGATKNTFSVGEGARVVG
jgi:hypothetical protein